MHSQSSSLYNNQIYLSGCLDSLWVPVGSLVVLSRKIVMLSSIVLCTISVFYFCFRLCSLFSCSTSIWDVKSSSTRYLQTKQRWAQIHQKASFYELQKDFLIKCMQNKIQNTRMRYYLIKLIQTDIMTFQAFSSHNMGLTLKKQYVRSLVWLLGNRW